MSELGKPFLKKSHKKLLIKQKINVKMPHVKKKPLEKETCFKKLGLEGAINGSGKRLRKKSDPNSRKNSTDQSKTAACA